VNQEDNHNMSGTYLIIGGAGRTGRRIADLLTSDSRETIIASRHPRAGRPRTVTVDLSRDLSSSLLDGIDGVTVCVEPPSDTPGAEALLHYGVARLARQAADTSTPVVLISQIYVTRASEHPGMADIIRARAAGEQALRDSGTPYTIIRPGWLTDRPATSVQLEQGDTGEGQVSRDVVAAATVAAFLQPGAAGKTFELYDGSQRPDWPALFAQLQTDTSRNER
jgi:uncharacterized protein YbjT (DUF2867 family)